MASKNPNTPTRARASKSTIPARPAAPRRRAVTRTAAPAATAADDHASTDPAIDAPAVSSLDYAEHVRIRAYYLHLERKGRPGNPVEDWLAAERELGNGAGRQA